MDQAAGYEYEPIREADEIRLLCLRHGTLGGIITGDLETVRIQESRYYDAISYTWADEHGDTTKCCSLRIGSSDALLPITRSCDSVLRQVRKHTSRVWIDAVCINQDDIQERGQQVDLMPLIYKGASRTFAYVGETANDSDIVLRNLSEGVWTPPYLLDSFFARPYFWRVWVVQDWSHFGAGFLQRVPGALIEFLKAQDPMFEDNNGPGLFFEGKIVSSLKTLEERADITRILMHLLNSKSPRSRKLPPAYKDRRVYVFSPRSRGEILKEPSLTDDEWEDPDLDSSSPTLRTYHNAIAFLVARVNGSEPDRVDISAQQKVENQEMSGALGGAEDVSRPLAMGHPTPREAATRLRDGYDGANNFELLGLIHIQSTISMSIIASRINFLGEKHQTMYTTKPCIIRIV